MDDIRNLILFLTMIFGLMKSVLDFFLSLRKKPRNGRKRSARHRTPSKYK